MKNLSFPPKGKTRVMRAYILWLVLFFVLGGFVQTQAQSKQAKTKPTTFKVLIKKEHRENFRTFKNYIKTLKPEKGNIDRYSMVLDSIMEIMSQTPFDSTKYDEWLKKASGSFEGLDSTTQLRTLAFVATLPAIPLTSGDLEILGLLRKWDGIERAAIPPESCCSKNGHIVCPCGLSGIWPSPYPPYTHVSPWQK